MNKIFAWAGSIALVITGLFFASNARKYKQRAESLTNAQVRKESSTKQSSLNKAAKLREKAKKAMDKSEEAGKRSKERQLQLEKRNAPNMAARVRDFNDGLRS